MSKTEWAWKPNPGPQEALLYCNVDECLYGGGRGGGKSYGSCGVALVYCCTYPDYHAIIFRRTFQPELKQIVKITKKLYPLVGGVYKVNDKVWQFPNGSTVSLAYLENDDDAENYQGHEYQLIIFDEAGNWPDPAPLDTIKACIRSANNVPGRVIYTANPGGVGHNWLKARFIDPRPPYEIGYLDYEVEGIKATVSRVFIPALLQDNPQLAETNYIDKIITSDMPKWKIDAWVFGKWDIDAGNYFGDVWNRDYHVLEPFEIPHSWHVDRVFDWGSSKPWACLWVAESDGTVAPDNYCYAPGSLFIVKELYGWNGKPNQGLKMTNREIALDIQEAEAEWGLRDVYPGPADAAIYTVINGSSVASDMEALGIDFVPADKKPGSRVMGWQRVREYLNNSVQDPWGQPGLYVFNNCIQTIRTFPGLPRDPKNFDDVFTESEDHIGDCIRYRVNAAPKDTQFEIEGF